MSATVSSTIGILFITHGYCWLCRSANRFRLSAAHAQGRLTGASVQGIELPRSIAKNFVTGSVPVASHYGSPSTMNPKLLLAIVAISVSHAAPPGLQTGIPAFLDTDGDGKISEAERQAFAESRAAARSSGGPKNWDTNGDGTIDEEERLAAVVTLKTRLETKLASLFLDLAGDDSLLTLEEFATLPQFKNVPPQTAANLFNLLDTDDDGFVTVAEFFKGIGRGHPPAAPPNPP